MCSLLLLVRVYIVNNVDALYGRVNFSDDFARRRGREFKLRELKMCARFLPGFLPTLTARDFLAKINLRVFRLPSYFLGIGARRIFFKLMI